MRSSFFFLLLSSCALVSGLSDVHVTDEGGVPIEAGAGDTSPSTCPSSCAAPPDGWQGVVRPDASGNCGALVAIDLTTGIDSSAITCPCSCTPIQPTCGKEVMIYSGSQCSGSAGTLSGGTCTPLQPKPASISAPAAMPVGGSCGAPSTTPAPFTKVTSRTCAMPSGCSGSPCAGTGQHACAAKAGMNACPADYPQQTIVGQDVTVTCQCANACSCSGACTPALLHFYSDAQCGSSSGTVVADGTCQSTNNVGSVAAIQYESNPTAKCNATIGTASTALVNPVTICCKN